MSVELFYSEPGIVLYCGDCREWLPMVESGSVDLVLTDPIYSQQHDYEWLGGAARWLLTSTGALLCWSNGRWHRANANWLEAAGLTYRWDFACVISTGPAPMNGRIIAKTNRLLWLDVDGSSKMLDYLADGYASRFWSALRAEWGWTKNPTFTAQAIRAFTEPGATVADPFAGNGSILAAAKAADRSAMGVEILEERCAIAARRLRNTTPPLPRLLEPHAPEQAAQETLALEEVT